METTKYTVLEITPALGEVHNTEVTTSEPANSLNETPTAIFNAYGCSGRISLVVVNSVIEILIFTLNVVVHLAVRKLTSYKAHGTAAYGGARDCPAPVSRSDVITYYFIKQLVYSDLITGFVAVPVQMVDIMLQVRRTRATCASLKFLRSFSATASFYLLAVINFERWWAISYPFRSFTLRRVRWLVGASWIYVFLQAIPVIFLATTTEEKLSDTHSIESCVLIQSGERSSLLIRIYVGVRFTFPFLASATFTALTVRRIKSGGTAVSITKAARAAAKFSINVTATLFLSCFPILVYSVLTLITAEPSQRTQSIAFTVFGVLRNINAVINPLLTIYSFGKIRGKVQQYLHMTTRRSFYPALAKYNVETGISQVDLVAVARTVSIRKPCSGPSRENSPTFG